MAHLKRTIYVSLSHSFVSTSHPTRVCKLHKALYGLKQAPCAWFSIFSKYLISYGFTQCHADTSLFVDHTTRSFTVFLLHVDDIILTDSSSDFFQTFTTGFHSQFVMKDLGPIHYFLRVQVTKTKNGIFLFQNKCIDKVLHKAGMSNVNLAQHALP